MAACILTALLAAAIPSKLDRPLVVLEVHPERALSVPGPFKTGSSRSGSGSDCTETQDEGSGDELAAKLRTFPGPNAPFQASFVGGSVTHWFHGQCFTTYCSQEGIEEDLIKAMLDWSSESPSLSDAVEELANLLLSMTTCFVDDSQPGEEPGPTL